MYVELLLLKKIVDILSLRINSMAKESKQLLTPKQEAFAIKYLECNNASEAYREVYDVSKDTKESTIWRSAHDVLTNPKVNARINEIKERAIGNFCLSVEKRKTLLADMALSEDMTNARGAIDLLNKMDGVYVEKKEITGKDGTPLKTTWTLEVKAPEK